VVCAEDECGICRHKVDQLNPAYGYHNGGVKN
jgi:hypothetical protein